MDILITISVWLGWLGAAISTVGGIVVLRYQAVQRKKAGLSTASNNKKIRKSPKGSNVITVTIQAGSMRSAVIVKKTPTGDLEKGVECIEATVHRLAI
jgi:hypothetical protein